MSASDWDRRESILTTFISYAFNLNLGSLVGGLGFRFRLYSRQGVEDADITRTIAFSMWTNWFGYITLAGVLFLFHPIELPADWRLPPNRCAFWARHCSSARAPT